MTEKKRFTNDRWQIYDNGKILSVSETEKLLNKLHDENEQLKQLNIPVDEIQETVMDYKGRIVGVYYND